MLQSVSRISEAQEKFIILSAGESRFVRKVFFSLAAINYYFGVALSGGKDDTSKLRDVLQ